MSGFETETPPAAIFIHIKVHTGVDKTSVFLYPLLSRLFLDLGGVVKKMKKVQDPDGPKNQYSGVLPPSLKDRANELAFWLGGRRWTRSQMSAPAGTGDKKSPGFNCTNYKAAPVLAAALEDLGIDSVRALCGLDLRLLEERPSIGDTCLLVAIKVIEHIGQRDSVYWSSGAASKVQSYAIHTHLDEAKVSKQKERGR